MFSLRLFSTKLMTSTMKEKATKHLYHISFVMTELNPFIQTNRSTILTLKVTEIS